MNTSKYGLHSVVVYTILKWINKTPLTTIQLYDLSMRKFHIAQYDNWHTMATWYRLYGSHTRARCRLLLKFGLIKKIGAMRREAHKPGITPDVWTITPKGKQYLNDTNSLYKKRA